MIGFLAIASKYCGMVKLIQLAGVWGA